MWENPNNQNSYCLDVHKDQAGALAPCKERWEEQLYFRALPDKSHLTLAPCADKLGQRIERYDVKADGTSPACKRRKPQKTSNPKSIALHCIALLPAPSGFSSETLISPSA